ncbi:MAG TPA: hypothetical protein VL171_18355 [Verrucomicrobiae bacterium]|nr:hypothetical protein [Verrucomicrobiae bacterium]
MTPSPTAPPSAWSAPLYPLVIAAAYHCFGIGSRSAVTALMLLNAVFFGLIVVGTVHLATVLFESPIPGLFAAALFAIHPLFLFYVADFWDGFMSLAIFVLLTAGAAQLGAFSASGGRMRTWAVVAFGIGLGLLALTNTSYVTAFPVLLYLSFWPLRSGERWRSAAIACGVCLLVISPWTIRNYQAFGRLIPVRTGSAIQLWTGNAPVSHGWLDARAHAIHPGANPPERQLLLMLGEPTYNDLALKRFEAGLAANPFQYPVNCLRRCMYLLVGEPTEQPEEIYPPLFNWKWRGIFCGSLILNAAVAILGFGGIIAARRFRYQQGALPILAASVALPFIATAVTDRYTLPLRWLLIFYVGACLWMMFRRRPA